MTCISVDKTLTEQTQQPQCSLKAANFTSSAAPICRNLALPLEALSKKKKMKQIMWSVLANHSAQEAAAEASAMEAARPTVGQQRLLLEF